MINVSAYLASHEICQIRNGKSGAEVWEIEGKYVLKYVQREKMPDARMFAHYQNEAYFYQHNSNERLSCLPEVLEVQVSCDEILILMKKYQEIFRDNINDMLLQKIMGALAMIHVQEIPTFLRQERKPPEYLEEQEIKRCLAGWQSVLEKHPGKFDEKILTQTAVKINELIDWNYEAEQVLTHGDFHWDNLLQREDGDIVVCDWQGMGVGGAAGDISFFLSRLGADGVDIEPGKVIELYCQERFRISGQKLSEKEMLRQMKAANIITTFRYWHDYLHNASMENVREIYEKMVME